MHQRICLIVLILAASLPPRAADELAADIPGESRSTAIRLEEAGKRLAEKKVPESITLLQSVIDSAGNDLVPLKGGRGVRARQLAHAALARLDAKGLALYRARVDPQAKKWLDAAGAGEASLLYRVVDEAFSSTHAPAALDQLGDSAFERAGFDEAEQYWQLLAPLKPISLADAEPDTLFYPDPSEPLAIRTRAKQLLARLFRGKQDWQAELDAFRKRYPKAAGTLAGRSGLYADILQAVADARNNSPKRKQGSSSWPTFAGAGSRGRIVPVGPRFLDRLSQLCRPGPAWRLDLEQRTRQVGDFPALDRGKVVEAARKLAFYPVVAGHHAIVADARFVTAYDLRTGKAETWYDPVAVGVGGINPNLTLPTPLSDLRYTLTVSGDRLFARLGAQTIKDVRPPLRRPGGLAGPTDDASILVCLGLTPDTDGSRRRWMVAAGEPARPAFFEGAPLAVDGRVHIAATRFEGDRVVTTIHCYPADPEDTSPAPLWRTEICKTRELLPAGAIAEAGLRERNRHHLLTAAGSRVVYGSHSGAVVALDGRTGARLWAVRYPRRDLRNPDDDPGLRDLSPCLYANGLLYVAPTDSESLFCLDPATGATVWQRDRLDVVHLLGVGQGKLIFTTWHNPREGKLYTGGLRAVGALDGSDRTGWSLPDDGGGLAPFGRGLLVGDLVLWPTARKPFGVFAVRQSDGMQPDNPSLLHRLPSGNLVHANGCLLVTDRQTMYAFVPPEMVADGEAKASGKKATDGQPSRRRLASLVRTAETSLAAGDEKKSRAVWQQVSADDELGKLSMEDENGLPQSARFLAASRLSKRIPEKKPGEGISINPFLLAVSRMPLEPSCEVTLAPDERLLPHPAMTGAVAARIWSNQDRTLFSRDRWTGELKWKQPLPFVPVWQAGAGSMVVLGGRDGLSARDVTDGQPIWTFLAPPLGRYPGTPGGEARVTCDTLPPEPLRDFHLVGGRLFAVQGERRLLALDMLTGRVIWQRWAPGATFAMPAPRGRFGVVVPVGDDNLLVQASGRLWLLDAATGKVRYETPAPLQRMPRAPIVLDGNRVCIVNNPNNVELLDAASAKTDWTWPLPGRSTRSGEPPLVVAAGDDLFVIVPENIGYRLHRLDTKTGKPTWAQPPLIAVETLEPDAWLAGPAALYCAAGGYLTARSRTDGSVLWRRPLSAPGAWKLALASDTLVLSLKHADGLRFRFRWLAGSVQWDLGPLTGEATPAVELLDAHKGTLLQRINLEDVSSRLEFRLEMGRSSVWPSARFGREPISAAGVAVWWDDKGLLAGLGNRVKSLSAQTNPGK